MMSVRAFAAFLPILLGLVCVLGGRAAADSAPSMRRIAVLIGSYDAPPGRLPLRFAHADAQQLADVLTRVGRFAPSDVHVLLDPTPDELAAALDTASRDVADAHGDALFVFYYSGHSDGQAVYPHGAAFSLTDLRDRIQRVGSRIRIGILDTCRGGSWTQAKGLSLGPPLDPAALFAVGTEGTALLSSSSGLEDAHESDVVNGSFFTHHLAAGLLGAADRSGDGNVTLEEAFEYAKERTVRDSARLAGTPQHPSFDLQLRGRQDLVLTSIPSGAGALEVTAAPAPVEVIHLASGITVAEAPPGPGPVRIAVPPARYLVRTVVGDRVLSREIDVRDGETVVVSGGQLEATGDARLAAKGSERLPVDDASTPTAGSGELQLRIGTTDTLPSGNQPDGTLKQGWGYAVAANYGITDRLAIGVPFRLYLPDSVYSGALLHYRLGEPGRFETILHGGPGALNYAPSIGVYGAIEAGARFRLWVTPSASLLFGARAWRTFVGRTSSEQQPAPMGLYGQETMMGGGLTIRGAVTVHAAIGATVTEGFPAPLAATQVVLLFGSTQSLASRGLPLVQVHLWPTFSLDGYAEYSYGVTYATFGQSYLAGFTWAF